ncbi:hypothetical protein IWW34DRAFT_273736 [Fusarium oxysporum f. sp. albedinis]|nr:hypothetical protein IWW34DRAFT_273736 [Fusarium oxysporum f. sp. albedinis]
MWFLYFLFPVSYQQALANSNCAIGKSHHLKLESGSYRLAGLESYGSRSLPRGSFFHDSTDNIFDTMTTLFHYNIAHMQNQTFACSLDGHVAGFLVYMPPGRDILVILGL